jgi:predicted outer membrane repeat protein
VARIPTSFCALRSSCSGLCAAIALAGSLLALPGAAAAGSGCKVINPRAQTRHQSLQAAVDAAAPGDRLRVVGTCVGSTVVDRNLTIRGVETATSGRPTLDGDRAGRVLQIARGVIVEIKDLVIRRGRADGDRGGGILSFGDLTLENVVVARNTADTGGGIYTNGRLELKGATSIQYNRAVTFDGGGVALKRGRLHVHDSSSIHDNRAARGGGGLYGVDSRMTLDATTSVHHNQAGSGGGGIYVDFSARLTLNGSSSVHHNTATENGGGVFDNSVLTMNDASSIDDNVAGMDGGGVFVGCFAESNGAVPGGNVQGNQPQDLALEMACP